MNTKPTRQTLTVRETAARLGVSLPTAYGAIRAGQVPAVRIQGRVLVLREPLERLLQSQQQTKTI